MNRSPSPATALGDEDGSITIEFVVLFPLLAAWLLGSFVYFDAYRSRTLTQKVATTVSDLVARTNIIDDAQMERVYEAQRRMLPRRTQASWLRVSSICYRERYDDDGNVIESGYVLHWSDVADAYYDPTDPTAVPNVEPYADASEIPVALMPWMANGDSIVLTELSAVWEPVAPQFSGYMGLGELTWDHRKTERPRYSKVVRHVDKADGNTSVCPPLPDSFS